VLDRIKDVLSAKTVLVDIAKVVCNSVIQDFFPRRTGNNVVNLYSQS
jgi:hypothetical protein